MAGHASGVPLQEPDDGWGLASAEGAALDVLVTGDRDLLDIAAEAPARIVNPRGLWELAQQREAPDA